MAKMTLDKALIRELAELLAEADLSEIEVSENGRSIRVARQITVLAGAAAPVAAAPIASPAPAVAPAAAAPPAPPVETGTPVPSPMVGTVYLAAEPGAAPFVTPGSRVAKGQTLLIVEAMKTMNAIAAPRDGVVKRIAVSNGQPVEYGETLVVLE